MKLKLNPNPRKDEHSLKVELNQVNEEANLILKWVLIKWAWEAAAVLTSVDEKNKEQDGTTGDRGRTSEQWHMLLVCQFQHLSLLARQLLTDTISQQQERN